MKATDGKKRTKARRFQIRDGNAIDIGLARALHEKLLPEVLYDFWNQTGVPREQVFLVAMGPDVLAYAWGELGGISGEVAYLREVGVAPEARRSGIGRALIAEFARRVADAGCKTIYVDPVEGPAEEELILYYERCGFTDPTRWRTTRNHRRGRHSMMEGSPAAVVRATSRWPPLIASNAWDVGHFGNGAFYEAHVLLSDVPPVDTGTVVLSWLRDERRTHSVSQPVVLVPSQEQVVSAGVRPLTDIFEWTTPQRTQVSMLDERAVVVLWPGEKVLLKLDGNRIAPLVVADSPIRKNAEWAAARGAIDIRSGDVPFHFDCCRDPVVEIALRELSVQVNRNTGVAAPEDRQAAIRTLRLLQEGGHQVDPREVFTFALSNRWYGDGAIQLRALAERVLQGRRFSSPGHHAISPEALHRWRRDATFLG